MIQKINLMMPRLETADETFQTLQNFYSFENKELDCNIFARMAIDKILAEKFRRYPICVDYTVSAHRGQISQKDLMDCTDHRYYDLTTREGILGAQLVLIALKTMITNQPVDNPDDLKNYLVRLGYGTLLGWFKTEMFGGPLVIYRSVKTLYGTGKDFSLLPIRQIDITTRPHHIGNIRIIKIHTT